MKNCTEASLFESFRVITEECLQADSKQCPAILAKQKLQKKLALYQNLEYFRAPRNVATAETGGFGGIKPVRLSAPTPKTPWRPFSEAPLA